MLPYIAGNFRWVQIFAIFAGRPASAKRKKWKLIHHYVHMLSTHVNEMVLYSLSVCPLNGCCKEDSASYSTKYQQTCKRWSEDVASTGRGASRVSRVPWKENFLLKSQDAFLQKFAQAKKFLLCGISFVICFENGFCASKQGGMGEVGGHIQDMPCTWWLPWLAVEGPWSDCFLPC